MENILGKWKLEENINFGDFLIFTQTAWYQRQIAEHSNIDITLTKLDENKYNKTVDALFFTQNEDIILDGKEREYEGNIKKSYLLSDNAIDVSITGSIVNWKERIKFKEPYLYVEYSWITYDEVCSASQKFVRTCL